MNQVDFKEILRAENLGRHHIGQGKVIFSGLENNTLFLKGYFEVDDVIFESGERYEHEIIIDGGVFERIVFRGGYFKKLLFRSGTFNGFVSIRGGIIDNLIFLGGTFNHWMGTLDGSVNVDANGRKLAEECLLIKRFEIEGGTFTNNIWISGGTILRLEIKTVSAVKIHCKPNDDKYFDTKEKIYKDKYKSTPEISDLILSRYSNKDNFIHISNITVDRLRFEDFTNIGSITISKLGLNNSIEFENSDLGKTTFIDCDFSKQKMVFSSSKITEIALAAGSLPEPSQISGHGDITGQRKLALSQIKKVYQNMGDMTSARHYHRHELETFRLTLPGKARGERLNLWLNGKTNKHGESWWRALWILVLGSAILYCTYCISLGFWFDFSWQGLRVFFRNFASFPEFLNPIRKSDFLPKVLAGKEETQVLGITYFIDSIAKIFAAYLIYQFIAAFRKHGKKE